MVIMGDMEGLLEFKKYYKQRGTDKVHTGKAWRYYLNQSSYEIESAESIKTDYIEVKWDRETLSWIEVNNKKNGNSKAVNCSS